MDLLTKQIRLLMALRAVRMFMISVPVIAVYWKDFGLDMKDIMTLQVIFSVAWAVLEIPSGYLADRFGNKPILLWGAIFGVLGYWFYWQVPTYVGFVTAELILAVSVSLISGSRDAILHDTVAAYGKTNEYKQYHSHIGYVGQLSEVSAALLATVVVAFYDTPTVLGIQFGVLLLAIPLTAALAPHRRSQLADSMWQTLRYCFVEHRHLLWFNVFTGAVSASTLCMVWYSQLHWRSLGIEDVYFGLMHAALMYVVALGMKASVPLGARYTTPVLCAAIIATPIVTYCLMALAANSLVSLAVVALFSFIRGVYIPTISTYLQQSATDHNRATLVSVNAMVGRLIFSVFAIYLGGIVITGSFAAAFALSALVFGGVAIVGYWNWLQTVAVRIRT